MGRGVELAEGLYAFFVSWRMMENNNLIKYHKRENVMSKNKNSTRKKTQEEKSREFSKAVEEKSREIAEKEQSRTEFSRAVEEKNRELSKKSENTAKAVKDANEKKSADNAKKQSDGEPEGVELVKATLSRAAAVKYIIIIAVVGGVSLAGIVM